MNPDTTVKESVSEPADLFSMADRCLLTPYEIDGNYILDSKDIVLYNNHKLTPEWNGAYDE